MRELIVTQNITVDGVIDATEGWFSVADASPDHEAAVQRDTENADAFLVGRRTFEEMRGYWKGNDAPVGRYLDAVRKYVVSSTLGDPEWDPTTVLRDVDAVRELKHETGGDIVCTGSLTLVPELIRAGLVDEFRLFTYPIVLGRGQRLFEDQVDIGDVARVACTPFDNGVVLTRYRASA